MATFDSQKFNGRYIRLTVTESDPDAVNNRSKVNWSVNVYGADGAWYSSTVYLAINGTELLNTKWIDPPQGYFPMVDGTSKSGSLWVDHNTDGTKTVTVTFNVRIYYLAEQEKGGTVTLSTLDRTAPTITTDAPTDITVSSASVKVKSNVTCSEWAYQIKVGSGSYGSWVYATDSALTHTFSITGLANNTTYTAKFAGKKSTNSVWGYANEVTFLTLGSATITSAMNVELGKPVKIRYKPLNNTHKFKLDFSLSDWHYTTDFLTPASTDEQEFTDYSIPITVANYITTSTTGSVLATLTTYDENENQIGQPSSKTFNVYVPNSINPVISSVSLAEGTQSGFNLFVKSLSTIKATVTASGILGSTITSITMRTAGGIYTGNLSTGVVESGILQTFNESTGIDVLIVVMDSRNRTTAWTAKQIVYDYYLPTVSASASVYGTTITTIASGSIASVNNTNQKRLTIVRRKIVDGTTQTYTVNPLSAYNFNETWLQTVADAGRETYEFTVTVYDKINSASVVIQTGVTAISRKAGGRGVTFFGEAQSDGFYIIDTTTGDYIGHQITSAEYIELATVLADNYSVTSSYYVGEFAKYNSKIWECKTAIPVGGEAWDASHWIELGDT